ncbi:MAG TPA: Gfo/Idh/MocA family oxidoreductase [Terriglobales bacterium]|nr:Gfo/Idh/MocA family oxidoreductase [Terriglobales bacterium]
MREHRRRRHVPEAKLVAVAGRDLARTKQFASQLDVEHAFTSLEALLDCKGVEAIIVATPTELHAPAVIRCAAAGKHVFCEKPLALTLEESDKAIAAVKRSGIVLHIALNRRFDPPYVEARRRILAGDIGTPAVFRSISRDRELAPIEYYNTGSGPLFVDMGIHDFDVARWLTMDEVAEVHAFGGNVVAPELAKFGDTDAGLANLRFEKGAIGNIELFRQARYGYDIYTEVVGTDGALRIGELRHTAVTILKQDGISHDAVDGFPNRYRQAFLDELAAFVRTVREGSASLVTGEDSRRALAIALAADKSRREHRAALLSETSGASAARGKA